MILGKNGHLVTDAIKGEARTIVSDVLTEALHDRQKKDGSVDKVLQPLVENSVQHSVTHHSERLVSSLYPLMGSLVRKSVTAFLTDFMEKTNQLIDSSFTIKGIKWRIEAWQAGVSYAQYLASKTFVYRVEHVFLIHRETGLLLNSIDLNKSAKSNADIISSMLTAINDFVGDSFLDNEDGLKEQLQTVTTDTFNLLIKPGPTALVVAAVIGNPPQAVSNQLQLTLEDIHRLYHDELDQFNGDNQSFINSDTLLRDCLLSEQKTPESSSRKTLWFAWLFVFMVVTFVAVQLFQWWEKEALSNKLMKLDLQSGVIVNQIQVHNDNNIELDILRDPDAISVSEWLQQNNLSIEQLALTERRYHSLDFDMLKVRAQRILRQYPDISSVWQGETLILSGSLGLLKQERLSNALSVVGFTESVNLNTEQIRSPSTSLISPNKSIKQQIFKDLVGRISTIQLDFTVASDEITPKMKLTLQHLYQHLYQLNQLADELGISFGLVVIGCSDNSGNKVTNELLSLQRAQNTGNALQKLGFSKEKMFITGLGQIEIDNVQNKARKVMFNVVYVDKDH
ncbi:MAG: hypothetical protein OQK09_00225 [Colwellia sp.]|nr:hypothetical protein [Colwellia sp.]MCW8863478.1 hypothetical protein [Colwellia sp.]MCW9079912.1 hypothetical protein [Colwellia sp.]